MRPSATELIFGGTVGFLVFVLVSLVMFGGLMLPGATP